MRPIELTQVRVAVAVLLMRSCNAVNVASILADCIDHYDFSQTAEQYLKQAGNEEVIQDWKKFVQQERSDGVSIVNAKSRKRQFSRFLKVSTERHETELRATLEQLKSTGRLDPPSSSGSSGEETD